MPLAEKGVRGRGRQPLSPPQHTWPGALERYECRAVLWRCGRSSSCVIFEVRCSGVPPRRKKFFTLVL